MADKPLSAFPCNACGKCCKNVGTAQETIFLDRGDGVCRHFDEQTNLCSIYAVRPLVCRVEDYYKTNLINVFSWDDFVRINTDICSKL